VLTLRRHRVLALIAALALVAAGCGSDEDAEPTTSDAAPATTAPATSSAAVSTEQQTTQAPPASGTEAGSTVAGDEPVGGGSDLPSSELEIRIWPGGREAGAPTVYTLTCLPDGGTLPSPAKACQTLAQTPYVFEPPPTDQMCTEQYGGPAVAEMEGRFQDIAIDAQFSRINGCEIARWDRAGALLPLPEGAALGG
jgi:Subtilisin inhibitor-like